MKRGPRIKIDWDRALPRIQAQLDAKLTTVTKACEELGVHQSVYYYAKKKAKLGTSVRRPISQAVTVMPPQESGDDDDGSIPVILTRLTPRQLQAFMRSH